MGKSASFSSSFSSDSNPEGQNLPRFDIHVNGSALEVVLITGLNYQFMFTETVRILHEEGADVVSASFSVVDHTVFHTIHSKVETDMFSHFSALLFLISSELDNFVGI